MAIHQIVLISVLACALNISPVAAADPKEACKEGRALYASGDVVKAAKSLARCVALEPRNRQAWAALANAELESGRFSQAADAFAKADALKPGDEAFLAAYLSALEGAGRLDERIPVLQAVAAKKVTDRKRSEALLEAVETSGSDKHPEAYLWALQVLGEGPGADRYHLEKLAAAYLKRGILDKAEAEFRGLLVKSPESAENWGGLGAALAPTDPQAAAECYRKAAFYSNQAAQRTEYSAEYLRLSKHTGAPAKPLVAEDSKEALLAAVAAPSQPAPISASAKPASPAVVAREPAKPAMAEDKPAAKAFDIKAYQDSIYTAELNKRLAALNLPKAAPAPSVPSVPDAASSPTKPNPAKEKEARDAEAKAKAENERKARDEKLKQDELARKQAEAEKHRLASEDKARKDSLARVAEKNSKAEKVRQEFLAKAEKARQDSLAQSVELKAKEEQLKREALVKAEKAKKDSLARVAEQKSKEEKARQEAVAKAEKVRQDSLSQVAELKAKEDKARQIALAQAEKARQEAIAKAEKARQDSLARVAEQKAREDKARQEAMAKAEKARQDSLARVAEQKAREEKARQEAIAKAEKARQDSLVRVAEVKAKAEKAHQDSLARVADLKAKEEKARLERERQARERKERFDRAYALYREGRMDSAATLFKAVLADSPVSDAWYFGGRTQLAKGDYPRAYEMFGKSPSHIPDLEGLKGKALMGMGKSKEALKAMEIQFSKSKDDSLLPDIVALKRKNGDAAGAIATLEILAEKRPGVIKHQEELATWWRGKGENAKASDRYSRVFILDPLHGEANYWLGMEAAKTGEHMRAVSMLERAVLAYPKRADAWKALAKANLALGRKDIAWETHRKAFALLPGDLELAKGRLALAREGHPGELAAAHEDVLRLSPGDADASMGLARIRFQQGNYAAAEKHFRTACKDSKDSRAWAEFGRSLLELQRTDEAAAALQKAVDLGDKDAGLRLDLARIRMDKGDLDWAEALVKDLARKSPGDPEPQYWLGRIALKRQQTAVAEEFFRKAHQLRPENGVYAEALARQLKDKDEWKPAVAVLAQSEAKLTPSGRLLYGDCLAHAGELAKALATYGALYQLQASPQLLARRMDLMVKMGRAEQAVESAGGSKFMDADEVKYSLAKAQLALAESHVLKGDLEQAEDLMKQVLKHDDHNPEYHYHLGLAYALDNKPKKALSAFSDALTYRVEYPEALYRKGWSLLALEKIKDAENAFGDLSQHAAPLWKARGLYGLALIFGAQGKPEALQHHLERSIAATPTADAMALLSRTLAGQGKATEAQVWARKATALDPGHEAATVALADALVASKQQDEAMELARQGLKVKPLSCGLLVQAAKLSYQAGKLDSTLAASNLAIKTCPEEPMAYFYAGIATHAGNKPKEAKQYFKAYRKLGGDEKLVPAK